MTIFGGIPMRTLFSLFALLLMASLIGCDQARPTENEISGPSVLKAVAGPTSLSKAERQEYSFTFDLEDEEPFIECRGELMAFHGIVTINIREQTTPSGNLLVRGWVEYSDDQWAEGTVSQDVWTLRKGLNPYTETLKGDFYSEEDFWVQNWQILEWYQNEDLGKLKIQWWGGLKFDKDGDMALYRDRVTCK
jgi:hypothetical protein